MKRISLMILSVAVSGCEPAKETGFFVADNAKDSIYSTTHTVADWATKPRKKNNEKRDLASTYCYRSQTDVLCYRQPMPGWEGRLVAYQGTDALPPPPPVMVLLPKSAKGKALSAENRVAAAKPVFSSAPKEEEKTKDPNAPEMPNSFNEQLPDPSQSPQL